MISLRADCLVNKGLNENSATKVLKRGFEFCSNFVMQSIDAREEMFLKTERELQKLTYQMKQLGIWDSFFTLTCNTSRTPGVGPIYKPIEEEYNLDEEMQKVMFKNMITVFARCMLRTVLGKFPRTIPPPLTTPQKGQFPPGQLPSEHSPPKKKSLPR